MAEKRKILMEPFTVALKKALVHSKKSKTDFYNAHKFTCSHSALDKVLIGYGETVGYSVATAIAE